MKNLIIFIIANTFHGFGAVLIMASMDLFSKDPLPNYFLFIGIFLILISAYFKFFYIEKHLKILLVKTEFDLFIEQNPDLLVCPTCLGNCGQCGVTGMTPTIEDGHWVYLKDLKNNSNYKQGWSGLISSFKK